MIIKIILDGAMLGIFLATFVLLIGLKGGLL